MKYFKPQTKLGWWSISLIVLMPILFYAGSTLSGTIYKGTPAGESIVADILGRPAVSLSMFGGMASGIAAFTAGIVAITKKKEHSVFVFVATIVGALLIIFLAGEVISPH